MKFIGRDGYEDLVAGKMEATERIVAHVAASDDLRIVSDPDLCLLAVESTSEAVKMWTVQRELSDRGWKIARQQRPESIHLSVMAHHTPVVDELLADLDEAVAAARAADSDEEATVPMYGLSGTVDDDEVVTDAIVDMLNEVFV
jgi:sphinganine-1-phosphate aldolase